MSAVLLVAGAALAAPAGAGAQQLFSLDDVRGDDDGNGSLIYPNRDDIQKGDLDFVRLSAEQRADGIWFVAEMSQPIVSPVGHVTEIGQTAVERLARNGFYTFNIDIYVDTDRIAGSGQTGTVPGRGVAIARDYAWEKAIILTPRPDIARTMLELYFDTEFESELRAKQGRVTKEELEALQQQSEQRVNELFLFPNKVRVQGRRIEFQVPQEFLGGVPSASWGYTALVTGCDLEQTGRPGQLAAVKPTTMMTMPVGRGVRSSQFGMRGDADEATPPVVDILAPDVQTQKEALSSYDMVSGRLAAVPGMRPDGSVAMAGSGEPVTPDQLARINAVAGSAGATGTAGKVTPAERRTVPARLRTLNELLADGLITQAEYNDLRRKILAEL
jgi:Membrane-anchored protein predicted to be involved in regulation of amylopullulanase